VDNEPKVQGALEAIVLAPMFESFEQSLGPVGSTAFEGVLTHLLERGDG